MFLTNHKVMIIINISTNDCVVYSIASNYKTEGKQAGLSLQPNYTLPHVKKKAVCQNIRLQKVKLSCNNHVTCYDAVVYYAVGHLRCWT